MLVLLLTGIGLIMVFSASYASAYYNEAVTHHDPTWYVKRQAIFAAAGVVVMYLTSKLNYQNFRWMSIFVLAAAFVLLILVKVPHIGVTAGGANRWIKLPGPSSSPRRWRSWASSSIFRRAWPSGTRKKSENSTTIPPKAAFSA